MEFLKKIFFPNDFTCDICGVETFNTNLCDDCKKRVIFNDGNACPVCGRKTVHPELCLECKDTPPLFNKAVSAFSYGDGVQLLIWKFKNGRGYLKEFFTDILAWKVLDELPACDCIVSVPMLKRDKIRRGYNQSDLLAKSLSKRTNIAYIRGAISKIKENKQQKTLSKKDRAENLKGCFKVEKPKEVRGKKVLIVDDVLTTGATADELARILFAAGASEVYLSTVASVEYNPIKK